MEPLKSLLSEQPFAKTKFTMMIGDVEARLDALRRHDPSRVDSVVDTIVLVGLEAHVCIIATCIDLIHRGFNVSAEHRYVDCKNLKFYKFSIK